MIKIWKILKHLPWADEYVHDQPILFLVSGSCVVTVEYREVSCVQCAWSVLRRLRNSNWRNGNDRPIAK